MKAFYNQLLADPLAPWYAGGVVAVVVALVAVVVFARNRLFARRLTAALANPLDAGRLIRDRYAPGALLRRSRLIESLELRKPGAVALTGIDTLWVERLRSRGSRVDLLRVLRFAPGQGLFQAFLTVLERPAYGVDLLRWLDEGGDLLQLRGLALACKGNPFDGAKARELLAQRVDQVWQLVGDPEWSARFFAVQVLLHDTDEKSRLALWDTWDDAHPLVRKILALHFQPDDPDRFQDLLAATILRDPAFEVRRAAWERLRGDFPDHPLPERERLKEEELLHLLELLETGAGEDESLALVCLRSDNLEIRLAAALFLEKSGGLRRLCEGVDMTDREGLERNLELLLKAREVNVCGYLAPCIEGGKSAATLVVCARVLGVLQNQPRLVAPLARKIFALPLETDGWHTAYAAALDCITASGDGEAMELLKVELEKRRDEERALGMVLEALPSHGASYFVGTLMNLLHDEAFPLRDAVREALKRMPRELVLPGLLVAVKTPWDRLPIATRIDSVRLLAEMELPYCLETVLENLWVLPVKDARAVMKVLPAFPSKLLETKVTRMLATRDSRMRAAVISALPATGNRDFIGKLEIILKDVDPDVRVAAIWALTEFEGFDWPGKGMAILEDPVERVRAEAARALGSLGTPPVLKALRQRLEDQDEALSVKEAVIQGLGRAKAPAAVGILVKVLEEGGTLAATATKALAGKVRLQEISLLFEQFKDAEPSLRAALTGVFRKMGERGGHAMAELLKEDIASLRPYILDVLDATGHVEWQARRLSHRDPEVRRAAADFLTGVGSLSALRGLVLAAKDPDEQVRVSVVRALEKLETAQGKELLESLKNDPARKVRRYTLWALERSKAKEL